MQQSSRPSYNGNCQTTRSELVLISSSTRWGAALPEKVVLLLSPSVGGRRLEDDWVQGVPQQETEATVHDLIELLQRRRGTKFKPQQ